MPPETGWITDMRLSFAAPLALAAHMLIPGVAVAGYDESQTWFMSLTSEQRAEAQADLVLLGEYYYLVDGQFGTGTYNALVAFQRSQGAAKTGVLTVDELRALREQATVVQDEFGIETVRDEAGQVEIAVPRLIVTETETTAEGTRWSTSDGGMTVETIYKPSQAQSFAELYAALSKPGKGRIITSKSFNDSRFVVTGHQDGREFYAMYKNTGAGSVGYSLTWSLQYAARGNVLSIYIASNFKPIGNLPPDTPARKAASPATALSRYGAFSLPPGQPDVIALDGEVSDGFYEDFERAISARPGARIMLLNSPGGYVDSALAVAREVHGRGMSTIVGPGMGCYSACSYIFFAGQPREAAGELGVHQISADVADLVLAQTTLGDVIDALNKFGVQQTVIVQMLRTPPEDMYVFSSTELVEWDVNHGGPVKIAEVSVPIETPDEPPRSPDIPPVQVPQAPDSGTLVAYVHLSQNSTEEQAERALKFATDRWAGALGGATPEVDRVDLAQGPAYVVRVPARSVESANAICSAIKSAGGGCYVTKVGR